MEIVLPSWKEAIDAFVSTKSPEQHPSALNTIVLSLHRGQTDKMLALIEELGPYLTSSNSEDRSRAILLIGEALTRLPSLKLNTQAISALIEFLSDRLADGPCLPQTIFAVNALLTNHTLPSGQDAKFLRTLFTEVPVQTLAQKVRCTIFEILKRMLDQYRPAVQAIGREFAYGLVQAVDGEKDPRGLKLTFFLLRQAFQVIPQAIGFLAEEVVDIASCYFPISFKPKPDDPSGMTRDDLVNALRGVFSASPLLAQYTIPFMLDQIVAAPHHKQEVLDTLAECCANYNAKSIIDYIPDLWGAIRSEVFGGSDMEITSAALACLRNMATQLSLGPADALDSFLTPIFGECIFRLPVGTAATAAAQVMLALMEGSNLCAQRVLGEVLPQLLRCKNVDDSVPQLAAFTRAAILCDASGSLLLPFAPTLATVFDGCFSSSNPVSVNAAASGASELCLSPDVLLDQDAAPLIRSIAKAALLQGIDSLAMRGLEAVLSVRKQFHTVVFETFSAFLSQAASSPQATSVAVDVVAKTAVGSELIFPNVLQLLCKLLSTYTLDVLRAFRTLSIGSPERSAQIAPVLLSFWSSTVSSKDVPSSLGSSLTDTVGVVCSQLPSADQTSFLSSLQSQVPFDQLSRSLRAVIARSLSALTTVSDDSLPLFKHLLMDALTNVWDDTSVVLSECAMTVVNKIAKESLPSVLEWFNQTITSVAANASADVQQRIRCVNILAILAKALAMRGDPSAETAVKTLLALLSADSETIAQAAASSCAILLKDSGTGVLTVASHCTVRILYKQRLTTFILPAVMKAYETRRFNGACASAVAVILQHAPPAALRDQLASLLPLLISSLPKLGGDGAIAAARAITDLINAKGDSLKEIESRLNELTSGLLQLARTGASSEVRIAAVECISSLTSLSYPLLFPIKQQIIAQLAKVTDDHKRTVRLAAAKCRSRWYLMNEPK